jgi:hypothetical protein
VLCKHAKVNVERLNGDVWERKACLALALALAHNLKRVKLHLSYRDNHVPGHSAEKMPCHRGSTLAHGCIVFNVFNACRATVTWDLAPKSTRTL